MISKSLDLCNRLNIDKGHSFPPWEMEIHSIHHYTPFCIKTGMWNVILTSKTNEHFGGSHEVWQGIPKGPSVKAPIRSTLQEYSIQNMTFTTLGRQFLIQSPFDLMIWCQVQRPQSNHIFSSPICHMFQWPPQMIYHDISNYLVNRNHWGYQLCTWQFVDASARNAGQLCGVGHPSLSWDVEVGVSVERNGEDGGGYSQV